MWECPRLLLTPALAAPLPLPQLRFNTSLCRWPRALCSGSFPRTGPCWTPCCHDYAAPSSQMTKFQSHSGIDTSFSHTSGGGADTLSHCGNCQWLFRPWPPVKGSFFQLIQRDFGWSSLKLVSVSEYGRSDRVQHEVCWARLKVFHYYLNKVDSHLLDVANAQSSIFLALSWAWYSLQTTSRKPHSNLTRNDTIFNCLSWSLISYNA